MGPFDVVLAPWRAARVLARAAEDLNAVAERARRDPDPVEQARERLDALFTELETLIAGIRKVDTSAVALGAGGEDLLLATRSLNSTARAIETGGRDLRRTGEVLDEHTQELITGGQELTAVAKDLADSLQVLRAALPVCWRGSAAWNSSRNRSIRWRRPSSRCRALPRESGECRTACPAKADARSPHSRPTPAFGATLPNRRLTVASRDTQSADPRTYPRCCRCLAGRPR